MIITIDGPSASGKSTIAYMLAQELGYDYLNSGFIFRAIVYILMEDEKHEEFFLKEVTYDYIYQRIKNDQLLYVYDPKKGPCVLYKNKDITHTLKHAHMDRWASIAATNGQLRKAIREFQRDFALKKSVVVEGRDTGSKTFDDADYKFYLTASVEVRAQRWRESQKDKGNIFTQEEAEKAIQERDHRDTVRSDAPLIIPEGAYVIDNSDLDIRETLDLFKSYIST
jgi:cytidylate kinase